MTTNSPKSPAMRRQPRQARSQERVSQILDVAEQMFISEGYDVTTTNAIAAQAKVSIGSLYQFFPDKAAILQALAVQHTERFRQYLTVLLGTAEVVALPLSEYVDRMIDAAEQFFIENPGYHAIFMVAQGTMPELNEIDQALDVQLIQDLSAVFAQRNPDLNQEDCEAIGFVVIKAMGNLLWMSLGQEKNFRQRLVVETKRLALSYLQSYFAAE